MEKLLSYILLFSLFPFVIYAHSIGPSNFYKTIHSHKMVLVKFWAPWCIGCAILKPEYEKAKKKAFKKVFFAEYNTDSGGKILDKLRIETLPTLVLFKNGKEIDRKSTILNSQEILHWLKKYY